jgi:hypothetical protein
MIEDIEGATSEPTRRGHVVVLSAAVAAAALVLLVALVVPSRDAPPQATSPSPSAGPSLLVISVASNPLSRLPVDLSRTTVCRDGTWLTPPYFLAFDGRSGQLFAAPFDNGPRRPVPVTFDLNAATGKVTVRCATSPPQAVTGDMISNDQEFDAR